MPFLSPQTAFLGFTITYCNDILPKNRILLLFKIYVYNSRKHEKVLLNNLIRNVTKVKNIENEIAGNNEIKVMLCDKKWKKIENKLNPVSLIYPRGGGETFLLRKICCFLLLLFYLSFSLFYFFSLFFVCVCVITFCGSFIILF